MRISKVCEHEVSVSAHEDIFWFNVTVYDTVAVNKVDGAYDVGKVETTLFGREYSVSYKVVKRSALAQFQSEIEIALVTKGVDYACNPW